MVDKSNIEARIRKAEELKASLEEKLEKVSGSPREDEFKSQLDKVNGLIAHLTEELEK